MSQDILGVSLPDVQGPINDFMEKLGGDHGYMWLSAFKKFLRKENPWEKKLDCYHASQLWSAHSEPLDSHQFFQTGEGLYVWDGFRNLILPHVQKPESVPEVNTSVFTLIQNAKDREIQSELPKGYIFEDPSVFCCHLAGLIQTQWGGKEGVLLNTGYANIFYVKTPDGVVAVNVSWHSSYRRWNVFAFELDVYAWHAGARVFSAAAVA